MIRKWKEGRVKEQSAGIKRRGKIQKLTAVDIDRQYLDSLKEIGNEWRRSWFQISVTILFEQKKRYKLLSLSLSLSLSIYIYIYIYIYIHCSIVACSVTSANNNQTNRKLLFDQLTVAYLVQHVPKFMDLGVSLLF